ncbi:rhomboid-related protein 4-like [Perca flavescens]|uniref:rhomboid-related protein 4-like n=1 Tax=Perca flavescens TaxID=8167 RepID=UPI00106DF7C8|nr:rhomboid-related protein 4-like [Perca flavescens]XP_028425973.1 rhomboid-related protein 4-like [Perca flavescens]XP_028425983.1 rhomboid-related protein 4-like [Perca flavescens]
MQRSVQLGLLLLVVQLFQEGLGNIPAVTLAVLGFNVYLYMFPAAPPIQACVSLQRVFRDKEWRRLFLSPLHHVDDWHLYFNMVSFIWKGMRLEGRLGAAWFLYLLSVFFLLDGLVYLLLQAVLTKLIEDSNPFVAFRDECAVGFSGVLFALKVVSNHYNPGGVTYVLHIRVSNRFASWVELLLIYLIAPGTSLVGHLAGILVGLLYTWGPLKTIMKKCAEFVSSDLNVPRPSVFFSPSGYSGTRREHSGEPQPAEDHIADDASEYTESFIAGLTEDEQIDMAIRRSLNNRGQTSQGETELPAEEEPAEDHIADDVSEYTESYVAGLTEEKQIEMLIRRSLNERVRSRRRETEHPMEEEVSPEELRSRRLKRFKEDVSNPRRGRGRRRRL